MRLNTAIFALCLLAAGCGPTASPPPTGSAPTSVEPLNSIPNAGVSPAAEPLAVSRGQVVFVPAYSHIYQGDRQEAFQLTVTLSVRNTSQTSPIVVRAIRYYNSEGQLVKENPEGSLQLAPLATTEFYIPQQDISGGSGANFIVEWVSDQAEVTAPVVEAVMVSTSFQQGVSFITDGRVIEEIAP